MWGSSKIFREALEAEQSSQAREEDFDLLSCGMGDELVKCIIKKKKKKINDLMFSLKHTIGVVHPPGLSQSSCNDHQVQLKRG